MVALGARAGGWLPLVAVLCSIAAAQLSPVLQGTGGAIASGAASPLDALDGPGARAASLDFGAAAPRAAVLPAPTALRGHWCNGRWCAELRPLHFAGDVQNRPAPYTNVRAPIAAKASRSPQSAALPEFSVLRTLKYGEGYVFGCRKGDDLRPTKTSGDALLKKWHTSGAEALSMPGFAVGYPGAGATGCDKNWKIAGDDHLVVILTDEGWAALLHRSLGVQPARAAQA